MQVHEHCQNIHCCVFNIISLSTLKRGDYLRFASFAGRGPHYLSDPQMPKLTHSLSITTCKYQKSVWFTNISASDCGRFALHVYMLSVCTHTRHLQVNT